MNIVYRFLSIVILIISFSGQGAKASTITLFLRPAPGRVQHEVQRQLAAEGLVAKINRLHNKSASQVGKKLLKNSIRQHNFTSLLPKLGGFVALYGGYVDYSDADGTVAFPLLHKEKFIHLLITPRIDLNIIHEQTVSHKSIAAGQPAIQFLMKRLKDRSGKTFWRITEEKIPDHKRINPLTVVILTKPKNIIVSTGDFLATNHTNLILPSLYVVGNTDNAKITLNFLDIRHFFEPVALKERIVTKKINQRLITNN